MGRRRKLSLNIYLNIFLIASLVISFLLASLLSLFFFYRITLNYTKNDFRQKTNEISNLINEDKEDFEIFNFLKFLSKSDKIRISFINKNGEVLFDSNYSNLENHLYRKEISSAFEKGEFSNIRFSKTSKQTLFYYTKKINEDHVLRLAKELNEIKSYNQYFLILFIPLILLCILSSYLVNSLVRSKVTQDFKDKLNESLKELNKSKQSQKDFVMNVSHELKTPLTAIDGFLELILNNELDKESEKKFLSIIMKNTKNMESLISDLLTLSKIEQQGFELRKEECLIEEIIFLAKESIEFQLSQKEDTIIINRNFNENDKIYVNKALLVQALVNLLSNAIYYSDKNKIITLEVKLDKENKTCTFTIIDQGIGIEKQEQERIFERFYRVDKNRSRSTGGTGLGLAIVKHIALLHKGNIKVESEINKGSRFTLEIKQD